RPNARALDRTGTRGVDRRTVGRRRPALSRRADRIRLRPHGNPVRYRHPGEGARWTPRGRTASDRVAEHAADVHCDARRSGPSEAVNDRKSQMDRVIIVGGGIAGLATAYELRRLSVPFLLLDAGARAGGVILSEEVDGFTIDAGPDSLLV